MKRQQEQEESEGGGAQLGALKQTQILVVGLSMCHSCLLKLGSGWPGRVIELIDQAEHVPTCR